MPSGLTPVNSPSKDAHPSSTAPAQAIQFHVISGVSKQWLCRFICGRDGLTGGSRGFNFLLHIGISHSQGDRPGRPGCRARDNSRNLWHSHGRQWSVQVQLLVIVKDSPANVPADPGRPRLACDWQVTEQMCDSVRVWKSDKAVLVCRPFAPKRGCNATSPHTPWSTRWVLDFCWRRCAWAGVDQFRPTASAPSALQGALAFRDA